MNELMKSDAETCPRKASKNPQPAKKPKKSGKYSTFFKKQGITVAIVTFVVLAAACTYLLKSGVSIGAKALADNYSEAYTTEKTNAYQELYQSAFDRAKKNYHVSNTVVISIGNLEEAQRMEVLKVNDVEFITEDRDDNSGKVTAWLEVTGEGTFVVDLKTAEYIIDNTRRYVLVRVPNPELTNINITDTQKRFFTDSGTNGSYSQGVDLALKQRNEASLRIQKSLMSNQYIYNNAKAVAVQTIVNMVKQFNPDIPDLIVDVEFMA